MAEKGITRKEVKKAGSLAAVYKKRAQQSRERAKQVSERLAKLKPLTALSRLVAKEKRLEEKARIPFFKTLAQRNKNLREVMRAQ